MIQLLVCNGNDGKEDGVSLVTAGTLILKELIIFKAVGSNVVVEDYSSAERLCIKSRKDKLFVQ